MSSQDTVVPPIPASPQLDRPSHTLNHDAANERVADQAHTIEDGDIFNVSDMNDGARQPASFSAQVATYQAELDVHYSEHEADIKQMSSSHLDPLDWDDLEARYQRAVSEKKAQEQVVMRDIETSFRVSRENAQMFSPDSCSTSWSGCRSRVNVNLRGVSRGRIMPVVKQNRTLI